MSGLGQLISTGWTGLDAATKAMDTVSNNTANVNTPGYNVESVQQAELPGLPNGVGIGSDVTSIQRSFNQFVFSQLVSAGSVSQAAQVVQNNAQNLAAIFPVASCRSSAARTARIAWSGTLPRVLKVTINASPMMRSISPP